MGSVTAQRVLDALPTDVPRLTGAACEAWSVGGEPPQAVVEPRDAAEAALVLASLAASPVRVACVGAGHHLAASLHAAPVDLIVSARRLAGITHYEPADLTFTAGAGTARADLDAATAPHRQMLALDPPGASRATLGALAATALAGPLVTSYGRTRDLLLGATLVTGDGRVLRLGGRVVKNVAGFDLLKLAVGGRGRLGLLTDISARLHPRPVADELRVFAGDAREVTVLARALATAPVVPTALEVRPASSLPGGGAGWCVLLRMAGGAEATEAALAILAARAGDPQPVRALHGAEATAFADTAAERPVPGLSLRATLPPAALDVLLGEVAALADRTGAAAGVRILPTEGLATLDLGPDAVALVEPDLPGVLATARHRLAQRGGSLTLTAAPASVVRAFPVFAPDAGRDALLARVIAGFDPGGVLAGSGGLP
ncbi:MAG: FAD-binding protein [Gemmatimonadota bacterium]